MLGLFPAERKPIACSKNGFPLKIMYCLISTFERID
jgi:hypothetical protein